MTQTISPQFDATELETLNAKLDASHPRDIIAWAAHAFGGGLIMTSSFGAESMCSIHLARSVKPDIKIVFINTGYLFPETIAFMEDMRKKHSLNVWEYHTRNDPVVWLSVNGEPDPRVRNNVDACCAANKNEVMDRAMRELAPAAWLRGVRADQSETRKEMKVVQWSKRNSCWAISPILRWNSRQIFEYMKLHSLDFHPMWERGYMSIGCNPATCTRAVGEGQDARQGRWAGLDKKECGIHLDLGAGI
jgi:phosphoadenosine phosphosulfate reductase